MRNILTLTSAVLALALAACGSTDSDEGGTDSDSLTAPSVIVTTNVWGDVVETAFGDLVDVTVLMPAGAEPHDFAPSAKQAAEMEDADLLIVNGAGLEAGMTGVIESVDDGGTPVFDIVDALGIEADGEIDHSDHDHGDEATEDDHDDHDDEATDDDHEGHDHDDEATEDDHEGHDHDDEATDDDHEGHDHGPIDPHVWLDPLLVSDVVELMAHTFGELEGVDEAAAHEAADSYIAELLALDEEISTTLSVVDPEHRVLITNHDSFSYFADHYGFEVVGAIINATTTAAEASAADITALVDVMIELDVRAVFAETTESSDLAESLAAEVGGEVAVVELFTGSLGGADDDADTYIGMMRANAERIAEGLGGD